MTARRQALGRAGEDAAAAWYTHRGAEVVERNWRCREGEIDLIVRLGGTVVFVEVKTRSSSRYGSGLVAVDRRKQATIRRVAQRWLSEQDEWIETLRFDVVDVDARGHLRVIEAAF